MGLQKLGREHGGVVVEGQTPNLEVLGSIPTGSPCCVLEHDKTPYSTGRVGSIQT